MMKQVKFLVPGHKGLIMELDSARCRFVFILSYNYLCKTCSISSFTISEWDLGRVYPRAFPVTLDKNRSSSQSRVVEGQSTTNALDHWLFQDFFSSSVCVCLMQVMVRIFSLSLLISFLTYNWLFLHLAYHFEFCLSFFFQGCVLSLFLLGHLSLAGSPAACMFQVGSW